MLLGEFRSCSKSFTKGFRRQQLVLKEVTWGIPQGSLLGLVGPNGSGKSTSIKLLLGLSAPTAGEVRLFGDKPGARAFRNVGYLPENPVISDALYPLEFLDYVGRMHHLDAATRASRNRRLLEEVGLSQHTKKTVRQFSKGMVQRLTLASVLVHEPELLILDEPMSGLDPLGRRLVIDLLAKQHRQGKTICFSSHLLHDIEELCDRIVVLIRGEIRYQGPRAELIQRNERYRLVFHYVGELPHWIEKAEMLGDATWVVYGQSEPLLDLLSRLQQLGARIIEYRAEGASLESTFLEMVSA